MMKEKTFIAWYEDSAEEKFTIITAVDLNEAIEKFNRNHFVDIIDIHEVEESYDYLAYV